SYRPTALKSASATSSSARSPKPKPRKPSPSSLQSRREPKAQSLIIEEREDGTPSAPCCLCSCGDANVPVEIPSHYLAYSRRRSHRLRTELAVDPPMAGRGTEGPG